MLNKRTTYSAALLASLLLLCTLYIFYFSIEQRSCAGVRILGEKEFSRLEETVMDGVSQYLLQNDYPVALDTKTNTIYISLSPDEDMTASRLNVVLSSSHPKYRLCFAPDPAFSDLKSAVSGNHPFTLLIVRDRQYVPFSVVFTTFPVLTLTSSHRSWFSRGELTLWNSSSLADKGYYPISTSEAEWHIRGGVSKGSQKPPYKINLKKTGVDENRSVSLLDLGADDDWILNSLVFDDLKIRELAVSSIWNKMQDASGSALKLPDAKFVEVLFDGEYSGLYLLRRRVDNKSLNLNGTNDILLKGPSIGHSPSIGELAYFIHFNPRSVSAEQLFDLMNPYFSAMMLETPSSQLPEINTENWLDLNALISAFILRDNVFIKNMYYLLRSRDDCYVLEFIPWDVDMAWGLKWDSKRGFVRDEALMTNSVSPTLRRESSILFDLIPSLEADLAQHWNNLRKGPLSTDSVLAVIQSCYDQIERSGAYHREQEKWGLRYGGEDSLDALMQALPIHLHNMDMYYQGILEGH